jgi:hypothetical protein
MTVIPANPLETLEQRINAPACYELAARRHLTPLTQGKLDGLCGVYSIINAIRVLRYPIAPLSPKTAKRLFEAGTASLSQKGLLDASLVDGMAIRHWKLLAALLTKLASTSSHIMSVQIPQPAGRVSLSDIENWVAESLAAGMPVLMHLGRSHQHYTVAVGIDKQHIALFDSWGLIRIKRSGFIKRHDLTANCLMRLNIKLQI